MLKQQPKIHKEVMIVFVFFVAELHKVAAASRLPNIAYMRPSYHHGNKANVTLVSIYISGKEK
jgi:hypothetical protein